MEKLTTGIVSLEQQLEHLMVAAQQFEYCGKPEDILQAMQSDDNELSMRAIIYMHDLAQKLQDAVVQDPRFPGNNVVMIRRDNNGLSGFYPSFFGTQLLQYALKENSAQKALTWLQRVLNTRETSGKLILLLWGVAVKEPISITPTISLHSPDAIPERIASDWIAKMYEGGRFDQMVPSSLDWAKPSAVLVMRTSIKSFTQYEPIPEQDVEEALEDHYRLNDVMLLLAVAGPCCPVVAATWSVLEDVELANACPGEARSSSMHEVTSLSPPEAVPIDADLMSACVRGFQGMHATEQDRIRTALKRIIKARMRHDLGDRAVEICTALETLAGDGETNEITHKVATRFARYLGGDLDARKGTFKLIKSVYGVRSKMVHGAMSKLPDKIHGMPVGQAIHTTTVLAGKFIARVLKMGCIPNWHDFDILE